MKYNLNDIVEFTSCFLESKESVKGRIIAICSGYGIEILENIDEKETFIINENWINSWSFGFKNKFVPDIIGKKMFRYWIYDLNIINSEIYFNSNNNEIEDNAGLDLL